MIKKSIGVGLIGLGNVGLGALEILTESAKALEEKLGFPLAVKAICSRTVHSKVLPALPEGVSKFEDWRDVVAHPAVDVVAELIGGTATAKTLIEEALKHRKSVVTANKELMALRGAELWELANSNGVNIGMEASVAGGIPIHTVMREGIAG